MKVSSGSTSFYNLKGTSALGYTTNGVNYLPFVSLYGCIHWRRYEGSAKQGVVAESMSKDLIRDCIRIFPEKLNKSMGQIDLIDIPVNCGAVACLTWMILLH